MAVVDPAVRPTHPSKGGRTNTALAGLAASLMLSLAYASMRVAVDDRLIDAEDIEALGLLPVLCVVPKLASAGSSEKVESDAAV
jgi:capsular polysaccharide biosynthesis protein